ncbi:MAG: 5-deoxy-glucuronate isomerase [Roseiflexaceae bacterium]|nr:5-deoxy-glucuronate isomerase [Roseiflexaceae bacterium]
MTAFFTRVGSNHGLNTLDVNPCTLLDFGRLVLSDGASFSGETGEREAVLVIFGGRCTVQTVGKTFARIGERPNPFTGKPYAVYLPAGSAYTITAHGALDAGLCSAPSDLATDPYVITPDMVVQVDAGAANFSRTLYNILTTSSQPELPAAKLLVGETFVPSGNWSTYPPHKHEVDNLPHEAYHEEMYYFRVSPSEGFGLCRHYSPERGYDTTYTIADSTIFMAPHGYHTTCSAPGYTNYFLWFLAGTGRIQAVAFDPALAWVQKAVPLIRQAERSW